MLQPVPTDPQPAGDQVDARAQRKAPAASPPVLDNAWRAGRKLSEARLQRGWTVDEVADRIRVRKEFLEALEEMNVKLLPGKAYALAFLRSYARELGIEEKAIVDQFQDECALTRDDNAGKPAIRSPASKPRQRPPWAAAAALVLIAAGFVGWRALDSQLRSESEQQAAVSSEQSGLGTTPVATSAATRRVVEIRALTDAWLETRGPDGTVFLSRNLRAGDVYRPDASPGWTLHARDGGAFELFVNGVPAGLLGTAGMPVLGRHIDEIQPLTQAQNASPRS
ncbi:MAG: helix-turn-helix domain-containing protein [Hyphomonadaceae bacterium]|nr:helix-turn-helix domain-containing protein [Hyphomonadaceae bacterium]